MSKLIGTAVGISAVLVANAASAQGMLLDVAADKVIKKYQTATCDELKAQKNGPPTDKEKEAIQFLRNDLCGANSSSINCRAGSEQDVRSRAW